MAATIWIIGVMFTAAFVLYDKNKMTWQRQIFFGLLVLCFWPFVLGFTILSLMEENKQGESK